MHDTNIIRLCDIADELGVDINSLQRRSFRKKHGLPIEKFCGKLGAVKCKWDEWKLGRHNG